MKNQLKKLTGETGATLVELLAAIAILSIIVTAFLGFFIQAAKTNQHTNAVNEATFLAQERMEEIIHLSKTQTVESVRESVETLPDKNGYKVVAKIATEPLELSNLYEVIVTVSEGGKERAKMETILSFKAK